MNDDARKVHENIYGKRFLIPLEVLPGKHFSVVNQPGHFHTVKAAGRVVEIEGRKYFEVERWEA